MEGKEGKGRVLEVDKEEKGLFGVFGFVILDLCILGV